MKKEIELLCLSSDSIKILKENKIYYIDQLNNKTRKELINMGIPKEEISIIAIKLEFEGFELKDAYEIDNEEEREKIKEEVNKKIKEALNEFLEEGKNKHNV